MAGTAFTPPADLQDEGAWTAPSPTPAPGKEAQFTPPADLEDVSGPAEEKPSFIKRAADAADWFGKFAAPDPSGTAGNAAVGAFDKAGEKLEHGYEHLGDVNVPYGSANGKQLRADVSAFDVPGATKAAIALGTAPVLGAEVAAGGPLAALGLGIGVPLSNYAGHKTREVLDWAFPSRSFHARLIKRMAEEGVSNAAFLAAPAIIKGFSAANALRDPGLEPEEAPEPPATAKEAPEGGLPPESPTQAESAQQGPLSKLTAKPETEPVAPGMTGPTGPTEMGPEPAAAAPQGPTAMGSPIPEEFRKLQRVDEPGVEPDLNKPHGLYLSPAGIDSPHREPGWTRRDYEATATNPLDVSDVGKLPIRKGANDSGAGVKAIKKLDPALFDELKALKAPELRARAAGMLPGVDVSRYYDRQEVLEAIGAKVARDRGHDALIHTDAEDPDFSEYAALHPSAIRELGALASPPEAAGVATTKPAAPEPTAEELAQEKATSEAAKELGQYPGGDVQKVPTDQIHTSPERFQYKLNTNKEGAGVSLNKAKFNPDLAETALLYHDPEDGKLYVVNGHNRLSRAKQDDFPYLESKVVDGGNGYPGAIAYNVSVEDARALGAIQNIASEKGTAVDAAKFFRDQKAGPEEIKQIGIDMSAKMTEDALALKKLDDNLFHFVTVGELTPNQGVIIGDELGDSPAGQNAAFKWLKGREKDGKDIPNDVLREVARDIRDAGESTGQSDQGGLFGDDFMKKSLFEERGTIMAGIKRKLAAERSAFGNAAKNKAKLEGVGNVLTDDNALIADQADNRIKILNAKKTGPINEVLNDAARQLSENPKNKNKIIEEAYEAITKAADETLPQEQAPEEPGLFGKPAKAPMEPGTTLGVSIPGGPQIARALEPELKYAAEKIAIGGKGFTDWVKGIFAPQTLGPNAKRASQIAIQAAGEKAAAIVSDEVAVMPLRAELEKIPADDWRQRFTDFYGPVQEGRIPDMVPPKMRPLIPRIREGYDQRWRAINALRQKRGKGPMAYLENFLTHMYADDPAKVRDTLNQMGKVTGKPLTQGTPFFKQRKYLKILDAMRMGLTPRFKNPIDMVLAGYRQMDSYIMAETMFQNLNDAGLLKFVPTGKYEEGWAKIPDHFFDVNNFDEQAGGMIQRGTWQAPKDVAKVLSNYLSPSAFAESPAILKGVGHGIAKFNAFRVGFSTFHFLNENNAAMAQLQGTGIARALTGLASLDPAEMANGIRIGAKEFEPISGISKLFSDGDKIMRALVEPGTQGAEYDRAVQAAVMAGMRVKPEQVGTLSEVLRKSLSDVLHPLARDKASIRDVPPLTKGLMGAMRTPGNLADLSSTALMNYYIPRVKLGAFYKLAAQEMEHYVSKTGGSLPWAMQREILQNVSHHVDSVFGQMVEDNLMMSRTLKDALHLGIAYPGWNIGSLRLLLKASQGAGRALTFRSLDTQQRLAVQFAMGMVTSQTVQNAMLQRMLAGTWPQTIQDLFQPQDGGKDNLGNPTRIAGPSYMRTYVSLAKRPVSWAQNIMSPVWGGVDDIVNNRERFTGRQIVDPQSPLKEQAAQAGEYMFRFALPFSFTNYERVGGSDTGRAKKLLGVAGYSPVPAQYLRTEAENYVYKLAGDKAPRVGLNEQQYAAKQTQNALEDAIRDGKKLDQQHLDTLNKLDPTLKEKVEADAAKAAQLPRIVNMMRRMTMRDVIDTYKIAERNGDVRNQKYAKAIIEDKAKRMDADKWDEELDKLSPAVRGKYQSLLREILTGTPPEGNPTGPEA